MTTRPVVPGLRFAPSAVNNAAMAVSVGSVGGAKGFQ